MRGYGVVYTRKISEGGTTLRWVYMQKFRSVWLTVACEQAVRALWRRGGKRKETLELRLWNLNSTFSSPVARRRLSCQISANQREPETNVNKH